MGKDSHHMLQAVSRQYLESMEQSFCPFELEPSWYEVLKEELQKPYMTELASFIELERNKSLSVFPPASLIFNAFRMTPFDRVKVVIVGQDPYHGPGQAHGLCFSVPQGVPPPPSLQNIFKELQADLSIEPPKHGCLISWAQQGVLLLNATLTVRQGEPLSHYGRGWERFTDLVLQKICERNQPVVFVLWGKSAQEKGRHFVEDKRDRNKYALLTAAHPSPLSAHNGFFGCRHFSKINEFLSSHGLTPIDWHLASEFR